MIVSALLGSSGLRSILIKRRAEQKLQRILREIPGREDLAERIMQNPDMENIQKGRELIAVALESLSPKDRKEISSGLYQDSVKGRAWYTAKLITEGRSRGIGKAPLDEKATA